MDNKQETAKKLMPYHSSTPIQDMKRIVIEIMIDQPFSESFFQRYIKGISLKKIKPIESYHITIGFIQEIPEKDSKALCNYIRDFIKQPEIQSELDKIQPVLEKARQFQGNSTVAIFIKNKEDFITLQKMIRSHIRRFPGNNSYDLNHKTQPENYIPHLSIGWGDQKAIDQVNLNISIAKPAIIAPINGIRARIL